MSTPLSTARNLAVLVLDLLLLATSPADRYVQRVNPPDPEETT